MFRLLWETFIRPYRKIIQGVSYCSAWIQTYITRKPKTYLNGIVHSHRKTEQVLFLTTTDVRCVQHWWHDTHRYDIQVLATHTSTWGHQYSSLLQWSVALGQRGHVAMVGRILSTKCTLHSNHRLTVWYSNTQNDFSPGAAIFSIHTLASPSGRIVNYDETKLTGK